MYSTSASECFLLFTAQNWVIDSLLANFAAGYGVAEEYKYLKRSISQYPTGSLYI